MEPHATERMNLERQVTLARPIFLTLALVDCLELQQASGSFSAVIFVAVYLFVSLPLAWWASTEREPVVQIPFWLDTGALAAFLLVTPSVVAFWFLFLFSAFAAGTRWKFRAAIIFAGAVSLALMGRAIFGEFYNWRGLIFSWLALGVGTFAAGVGIGYLGAVQRRHAAEQEFLARLGAHARVEDGVAESIRAVLTEVLRAFAVDEVVIVFRELDLERLFVWRLRRNETGRLTPESLPLERSDAFLLDQMEVSVCWNSLEGEGDGFGWMRETGRGVEPVPRPPAPSRKEWNMRSLMAVTFEHRGQPAGRLVLLNAQKPLHRHDLRWLERIARHLGPGLENMYLLRQIRARAIESERTRIAHDLHDGILQTLLSVVIQLDVLSRRVQTAPDKVSADLLSLRQTLKNEGEELRRIVTDLRPLGVVSADLLDLMRGYADRFRSESGIALDLIADTLPVDLPDRVCRELFQIYREALNNIKKHARASHVVVKLWQDDSKVRLVVDDNGQGFSFAGNFSSEELDRLRLGPISIKERTRGIGGNLTVESNPGHGAKVVVEVPVS